MSPTVFREMIHYNGTRWKSRDFVFVAHYFQLLVVAIFGVGAIFQLLVLAILAIFWRIRFWHFFQPLVLAIFGAGAIFQLLVLAIFGDFLEDLFCQPNPIYLHVRFNALHGRCQGDVLRCSRPSFWIQHPSSIETDPVMLCNVATRSAYPSSYFCEGQ